MDRPRLLDQHSSVRALLQLPQVESVSAGAKFSTGIYKVELQELWFEKPQK
jgi:hypothetical protein